MGSLCDLFGQYDLSVMGQPETCCSGCFWAVFWLLLVEEVWGGCPGTSIAGKQEKKKNNIKLNHVVTSYGDCTCNRVNGDCWGACGWGGWLMLHRLEIWEVLFSCVGFSLNEKTAL